MWKSHSIKKITRWANASFLKVRLEFISSYGVCLNLFKYLIYLKLLYLKSTNWFNGKQLIKLLLSSWYVETVLTIYCPMNFSAFPLDVQICHFEVGSIGMESKDVIYIGETSYSSENQRPTAFEVNICICFLS